MRIFFVVSFATVLIASVTAENCGPAGGNQVCASGQCCSQYGWCGASTGHCGSGCQSGFGTCGTTGTTTTGTTSTGTTTTTATSTGTVISTNGQCGSAQGTTCPSGSCCSEYGYCGSSSAHCGTGCQSGFGTCSSTGTTTTTSTSTGTSTTTATSTVTAISTNGQCGSAQGTRCPSGSCCSEYGYCGSSSAHCGTGCQAAFGICTSSTTTTSSTSTSATTTTTTTTTTTSTPAPVFYTCSKPNTIALTFDDGPFDLTPTLLDLLKEKGIKATFFVNGNNYNCIYNKADIVKRIVAEGHQIASHTWSHPTIPSLSDNDIRLQMTKLEAALKKIAGVVPRYMRLPFGNGDTDPRVLGILGSLGYRAIMWDLDSGDTLGSSADQVIKYFEDRAIPPTPHIPVNHDSQLNTVNVTMPVIIDMLKQRGYSLETVGSCLGDENGYYKETTTPSSRDSTWVC